MKLNHLDPYLGKKSLKLEEALGDIDIKAERELDGETEELDDDAENLDVDIEPKEVEEVDIDTIPDPPEMTEPREYNIQNVYDQLEGMIGKWFKLAADMPPEKKENFLKLGDRLDEIAGVLRTEFM